MDTSTAITFNAATHAPFGMPEDRLARMAARRAFVEMKTSFIQATAVIPGTTGERLLHKVRMAADVMDLWRLRRVVFAALPLHSLTSEAHRAALQQQLDYAFPEHPIGGTAFVDF